MDTLIVGGEPCTIPKIVDIVSKSSSFSVLCTNWKKFARSLGVPEVDILKLKNDLRLGVNNLDDLLEDLLYVWMGKCGNDATLEVLCQALTDCNLKDIADKLEIEFTEKVNAHILANGEVSVYDKVIKISDIFNTTASISAGIAKNFKKDKPIQILKDLQIPNRPTYYIQRTVSPRTRLNTKVFESDSSDVFVLENLNWSNLDNKLFGSNVELSSRQTVCVTAKFILLDFEKDYERICKVAPSHTPVHLVRFEGGNYYWVRSRGSLELIQQHISLELLEWSEQEFVENHLRKFQNAPVCIADTPGMGKSLLLASIAQKVKESCPDRVVLFMVLRELGQSTDLQAGEINTTMDLFWKQITTSDFATEALKRLIESGRLQFELFLDGFDEVLPTQTDFVNQLLLSLKLQKNIRVHVTTRPHMRNQLEETLGVLGYNMLPFTEDNQVQFLTRFWKSCKEAENEELDDSRLKSFANRCLEMLRKSLNKLERDIAGIPLQCAMLAEVYAYDAVKYSMKQSSTEFELTCKVESIFHMYQQLMIKKMKRVEALGEGEKQKLFLVHVHEAIKLIFPSWVDRLACIQIQPFWKRLVAKLKTKFFASQSDYSASYLANLYAVGLMEPGSSDAGASPKFLHRTFAEFLIAEHLVKHLRCKHCSRLLVNVVLGELTEDSKDQFVFALFRDTSKSFSFYGHILQVKSSKFIQNIIAYFVNAHLGALGSDFRTSSLRSIQNVDEMLRACFLNNYANIFHLLSKVVLTKQINSDSCTWTNMALLAARYSEPNLMEQLIQLIQRMEGKHLCELEFPKHNFGFPVTPLHVAVQGGSHIMTRYLVNKIYTSLESLPHLLYSCVYKSTRNSDPIIKDKIEVIRFLIGRRKELAHERLPGHSSTPLLLPNVHVDLMCTLIEQGTDVNAVEWNKDTVLHIICKSEWKIDLVTPAGYTKVFNLLRASKFNLWDEKGGEDETPLYVAVKSIEVEHSVLDQYSHLNVDFNHAVISKYGDEYSVLFSAISGGRTVSFIKKLEQLRANLKYVNSRGESALHIASRHGNYDVARYLVTYRNFGVNHRDCNGITPLHLALCYTSPNHIKIQAFLMDNGAELEDPEYKWKPTPLYYALSRGHGLSFEIVQKMVEKGLGPEHLALALEPLVRNSQIFPRGKRICFMNLFRYLYEHGGRIQNASKKKLAQHKSEFAKAIFAINDQLLEQLKVSSCSATDLCERIISGKIQLEQVMLALLECNQLEAFEAIRELLRYKIPKFEKALPGVEEFIFIGNQMIVVVALDIELCTKRVFDTIDGVEEYPEGMDLLPGTLCLVKVHQQHLEHNFREYLNGLAQLPYRFIVVCDESLAAEVEHTCKVVRDHIGWDDLLWEYKRKLRQGECIGFQLSHESKYEFFGILKDENLNELMRNGGSVSTDHLGRIIEHLVGQLDDQQIKVIEGYTFKSWFPSNLVEIMNAVSYFDEDKGQKLIQEMKWTDQEVKCVGLFVAARAVLKTTLNNQQQMKQILDYVFECEECQQTNMNEEEDMETHKKEDGEEDEAILLPVRNKCNRFKHDMLVYFIDWLVGMRGYKLPDFQPDSLEKYTLACLNSNAVNLLDYGKQLDRHKI